MWKSKRVNEKTGNRENGETMSSAPQLSNDFHAWLWLKPHQCFLVPQAGAKPGAPLFLCTPLFSTLDAPVWSSRMKQDRCYKRLWKGKKSRRDPNSVHILWTTTTTCHEFLCFSWPAQVQPIAKKRLLSKGLMWRTSIIRGPITYWGTEEACPSVR